MPKGHVHTQYEQVVGRAPSSEIEPKIDDKVMSSLVCNRTSELKGKDGRLFKCKDSQIQCRQAGEILIQFESGP